jgi:GNAT superfamily N-acetyltransferase
VGGTLGQTVAVLHVRTAGPDDAPTVGRTLADGFHDDPVLRWALRGDDDAAARKLQALFRFIAAEADVPLGATYLTDGGCACWTPLPGTDQWPADRGTRFQAVLAEACEVDDIERLGILSSTMDDAHPTTPHWYLGSIAVTRDRQGTGIGTALLHHSLAVVDETASPAYLESTNDRNVPLYERHGFRTTGRIHLPDGPHLTQMWREAMGPASGSLSE